MDPLAPDILLSGLFRRWWASSVSHMQPPDTARFTFPVPTYYRSHAQPAVRFLHASWPGPSPLQAARDFMITIQALNDFISSPELNDSIAQSWTLIGTHFEQAQSTSSAACMASRRAT